MHNRPYGLKSTNAKKKTGVTIWRETEKKIETTLRKRKDVLIRAKGTEDKCTTNYWKQNVLQATEEKQYKIRV